MAARRRPPVGDDTDIETKVFKAIITPHPSLAIIKFWQGALEILLRITCMLLAIGPLSAAAVVVGRLDNFESSNRQEEQDHFNTNSAAIWLLVVLSLAILLELLVILVRFLNFDLIRNYKTPLVADFILSFGIGAGILAGAVGMSILINNWNSNELIQSAVIATAATGYVSMVGFCVLGLWIIITLVFRWNTYVARHMDPSEFDEITEK